MFGLETSPIALGAVATATVALRRESSRLAALWPRPLRALWAYDPWSAHIKLRADTTTPSLATPTFAPPILVRRGVDQPLTLAELQRLRRKAGPLISATLQLPQALCFVREITLPRAALKRADDILRLDLERTTPFQAGDVYAAWHLPCGVPEADELTVHQVILKRSAVASLVSDLGRANIPLRSITVVDAAGRELPINLLQPTERRDATINRALGTAIGWAAAAAAALWIGSVGLTWYKQEVALDALSAETVAVTRDADDMRKLIATTEATATLARQPRLRKLSTVPAIAVWEDLTRILPATTSLTDLRIADGVVQIEGASVNASELIGLLSRSPQFSGVTFASPVTRDAQRNLERFQIRFQAGSKNADASAVRAN